MEAFHVGEKISQVMIGEIKTVLLLTTVGGMIPIVMSIYLVAAKLMIVSRPFIFTL
jgi:hypothetical protein